MNTINAIAALSASAGSVLRQLQTAGELSARLRTNSDNVPGTFHLLESKCRHLRMMLHILREECEHQRGYIVTKAIVVEPIIPFTLMEADLDAAADTASDLENLIRRMQVGLSANAYGNEAEVEIMLKRLETHKDSLELYMSVLKLNLSHNVNLTANEISHILKRLARLQKAHSHLSLLSYRLSNSRSKHSIATHESTRAGSQMPPEEQHGVVSMMRSGQHQMKAYSKEAGMDAAKQGSAYALSDHGVHKEVPSDYLVPQTTKFYSNALEELDFAFQTEFNMSSERPCDLPGDIPASSSRLMDLEELLYTNDLIYHKSEPSEISAFDHVRKTNPGDHENTEGDGSAARYPSPSDTVNKGGLQYSEDARAARYKSMQEYMREGDLERALHLYAPEELFYDFRNIHDLRGIRSCCWYAMSMGDISLLPARDYVSEMLNMVEKDDRIKDPALKHPLTYALKSVLVHIYYFHGRWKDCDRLLAQIEKYLMGLDGKGLGIQCRNIERPVMVQELAELKALQSTLSASITGMSLCDLSTNYAFLLMLHAWLLFNMVWYYTFHESCRDLETAKQLLKQLCMLYFDRSGVRRLKQLPDGGLVTEIVCVWDSTGNRALNCFFASFRKIPVSSLNRALQSKVKKDGSLRNKWYDKMVLMMVPISSELRALHLKITWSIAGSSIGMDWYRLSGLIDHLIYKVSREEGKISALYFEVRGPHVIIPTEELSTGPFKASKDTSESSTIRSWYRYS
ncbi:hypothetical protein BJ508DRAFT_345619 [Ascobolus immersus RN42]|uniref:Fungal N-terminal domain-containing protein n=1 Tax=Ascobolus immersus RN42 TaxID=1160509 RepID=A0A3N4I735_ASCIM|nr:hypothetical protein BJ508DRAFT_345619 [Ascobolus immersus RN42]